jgi:hypothetical protein
MTAEAKLREALAQEIRRVDGNHSISAGALAEALMPWLASALEAARREAYSDLRKYGVHQGRCEAFPGQCTCGLEAALASRAAGEGKAK